MQILFYQDKNRLSVKILSKLKDIIHLSLSYYIVPICIFCLQKPSLLKSLTHNTLLKWVYAGCFSFILDHLYIYILNKLH